LGLAVDGLPTRLFEPDLVAAPVTMIHETSALADEPAPLTVISKLW